MNTLNTLIIEGTTDKVSFMEDHIIVDVKSTRYVEELDSETSITVPAIIRGRIFQSIKETFKNGMRVRIVGHLENIEKHLVVICENLEVKL